MFDFETEREEERELGSLSFLLLHMTGATTHIHGNFQPHKRTIYAEMQITIISGNLASVVNQS